MRALRHGIALSIVIAAAACSVPDREFHATDGGVNGDTGPAALDLVIVGTHLDLNELGASQSFTVALNRAPDTAVHVTITADKDTKVSIGNGDFYLDKTNFGQAQTVTVSASDDDDAVNDDIKITVAATGLASKDVSVHVTDNDTLALATSSQTGEVTMDEGSTLDLQVHLTARPLADVIVTPGSANTTLLPSPGAFTIPAAQWDQDTTVHLFAPRDANAVQDDVILTFKSADPSTEDPAIADLPLTVHIADLDQQGITVTPGALGITEDSTPGVLHVRLNQDPVVSTDVTVSASGKVGVLQGKLTFTSQDYTQDHDVTVTTPSDDDTQNETGQVTLTMGGITRTVDVTVTDDDTQTIQEDAPATLQLNENATATFNVWLKYKPSGPVRIDLSSLTGAATVASGGQPYVDFDATNWSVHKPIVVSGVHDQNLVDNTTTIRMSNAAIGTIDVPTTVKDVDQQVIVLSSTSLGTITEGQSTSFTVTLMYDPGGTATVALVSNNASVGVPATISFGSNDYTSPHTVTVNALQDDDANPLDAVITLSGASAPASPTATIHVNDDDTLGLQLDNPGPLSITENASQTVHVHLTAKPDVSVTVMTSVPVGQPLSATSSITFAPSEWNTDKAITLNALDDANALPESIDVSITSSPNIGSKTLHVDTVDDDSQGILVQPTGTISLTEQGAAQTVSVTLNSKPAADVIVSITLAPTSGLISATKNQLTFHTTDYNVAQTFDVSAPSDPDTVGGTATITLAAASLGLSRNVSVNVTDDDHQAIMTSAPSSITLSEGGTTTFDVWLAYQPPGNVNVAIGSSATGTATVTSATGATLTFTSLNYGTHQTVTVTGVHDQNLSNDNANVTVSEATIGTTTIPVLVNDVDKQTLLVAPTTLTINEGSSKTFTVALKYDPGTAVNVGVASDNVTSLPASPSGANAFTFDSSNYTSAKTVTVNAPTDGNTIGETANITVSGAGATSVVVSAAVNDLTQIVTMGWPTYFGQTGTFSSDTLLAYSVTVPAGGVTVNTMKVIAGAASGNARMAIYRDSGADAPDTIVAGTQSGSFALKAYPQVSIGTTGDTLLPAGKYWVAVVFDSSVQVGRGSVATGQTGRRCTVTMVFGGGFPSSFGTATCATTALMNIVTEGYQ